MAKHQTGIRIDRILFREFQEICRLEKLRPGEAVESLIRLAVSAKSVTGVHLDHVRQENTVRRVDDALFRSLLNRFRTALELEEKIWKETGEEEGSEKESEYLTEELAELGRRNVSPELVKEFEALLAASDKFYTDTRRFEAEEKICRHKARIND